MSVAVTQSVPTDVTRGYIDGYSQSRQRTSPLVSVAPNCPTSIQSIVEALRSITLLVGLTDEEYTWLAMHGVERVTQRNVLVFRQGEPIYYMTFILRGQIQIRRRNEGPPAIFVRRAGQTGGLLPYSRMKSDGGDGICTKPVCVLDIHKDLFPEMLTAIPSMGWRCISALIDRVREDARVEHKWEKCKVLGSPAADPARGPTDPLVGGDIISGGFQIVRLLGQGGMGHVYQAHDLELGVNVAIKIIRPELSSNPQVLARFQAGIVHRDIKPANVMVVPLTSGNTRIDRVVVTDFGLAKFEEVSEGSDASSISHVGSILGTVAYMAPEQLRGEAATIATDIYAFGLVLYEMVTGVRAFPDSQSMAAAFRRITQPQPSPRALVPSLTFEWKAAVRGCLEVDPATRFQRATDVIAVLEGHRPLY